MTSIPTGLEDPREMPSFKRTVQRKTATFPMILHYMLNELEKDNLGYLMSWQPNGRSFIVRNPKLVEKKVIPLWFRQSKFTSFQRQLNFYGFTRIKTGPNLGGYFHKLFVRGNASLAEGIGRSTVNGRHCRTLEFADNDPNIEAIPIPRSEGLISGNTNGLGASKRSKKSIVAAAADPYSPRPTSMQPGEGLNIDCPKGTHPERVMPHVPCLMVKSATLAPMYTLKEAIHCMSPSSQPHSGRAEVTTRDLIQQDQVRCDHYTYTTQSYIMAYLRAEVMNTFLESAAAVSAAASLEEFN